MSGWSSEKDNSNPRQRWWDRLRNIRRTYHTAAYQLGTDTYGYLPWKCDLIQNIKNCVQFNDWNKIKGHAVGRDAVVNELRKSYWIISVRNAEKRVYWTILYKKRSWLKDKQRLHSGVHLYTDASCSPWDDPFVRHWWVFFRMTSEGGVPEHVVGDRGANFIWSDRQLKEMIKQID